MNIFVANLNFRLQDERLRQIFEEFGQVTTAKVIMDRKTNKSKGFGFVEMPEDREASLAIKELDGADIDGRNIVVKRANARS